MIVDRKQLGSLTVLQLFFTLMKMNNGVDVRVQSGVNVGAVMSKQQGEAGMAAAGARSLGRMAAVALVAAGLLGGYPAVARHVAVASEYGPAYEAIVLDAATGQVLRELNPDVVTYPASLTKMMTLYLT